MARVLIAIAFLASMQCVMSDIPNAGKFFKKEDNLTDVLWAHRVNTEAALIGNLTSASVNMIEADVRLDKEDPIMAHDENDPKNFTLKKFLELVITKANKTKGIKLDFKTIEAIEKSVPILKEGLKDAGIPVWLNADIFPGPGGDAKKAVDAQKFLNFSKTALPGCTLSLGWTTEKSANNYTDDQIKQMKEFAANQTDLTVTFPVRAANVLHQADQMKKLLEETSKQTSTLTVWSADDDNVTASDLTKFIKDVGLNKVYVDVPEALRQQLRLNANSALSVVTSGLVLIGCLVASLFRI